jgi:hypothetical protein
MTADKTLLKVGCLAIAAILFLIGGFLDFSSYDQTVTMWGVAFTLVCVSFLLDHAGNWVGPKRPGAGS